MNFTSIVNFVCTKIGQVDDYTKARCLEFVQNRHRLIYESFDWTAAQDTITVPVTVTGDTGSGIEVPEPEPGPTPVGGEGESFAIDNAEKIISARFNGQFLDPVTASYVFENHPEMLSTPGKPVFYWTKFDPASHSTSVRLFPAPGADGSLDLLIKKRFDDSVTEPLLPNIDDVLIAFALADMWEFLRQLAKYQAKLTEAQALLTAAQQRDTPSTPRPRASKNLTASGSTLVELTDSVCDIIGRWEPDIRESVKERIRRNNQFLWDMQLWPESIIIANCPVSPDQQQIVLPYLFDRVVAVRTNEGGPLSSVTPLKNAEISYYFDIDYNIFERSGEPVFCSMLPNIAVATLPPFNERLKIFSDAGSNGQPLRRHGNEFSADAGLEVFIKGESRGVEFSERLALPIGGPRPVAHEDDPTLFAFSANSYDTPLTVSKPETTGNITVMGVKSKVVLLTLGPKERERKHLRIWLLPNENPQVAGNNTFSHAPNVTPVGNVLVCGKRQVSPLLDDLDSPQLRSANSILIAGAAADMFDKLGNADMATKYQQKAAALTQALTDAETKQNAYQPRIVPYTEGYGDYGYGYGGDPYHWKP